MARSGQRRRRSADSIRSIGVVIAVTSGVLSVLAGAASPAASDVISTVAGGIPADGAAAGSVSISSCGLADASGAIYVSDCLQYNVIWRVSAAAALTRVAGTGTYGFSGDGGPATAAQLARPAGTALDQAGNLYIADSGNHRVRRVAPSGTITTVAGDGTDGLSGDGGTATAAQLSYPEHLALDGAGNLFIADGSSNRVRRVAPSGMITTVAGTAADGFSGDGGPATAAQLAQPKGVAADSAGNLYIADSNNHRVRKVAPSGTITTVAGTGVAGSSGDAGPATGAQIDAPDGIAVDGAGNLYIADSNNHRVRRVAPSGTISTAAGNGVAGFSGDAGPATGAQLDAPQGVAVDGAGNLDIADSRARRVRRVGPSGTMTTVAGNGTVGFSGDGGPAASAQLSYPNGVATDAAGNLYIADSDNDRVRRVAPNGTITTIAGNGSVGSSGDGGPATAAQLDEPKGVAVDSAGNLFVADAGNDRVRRVTPSGTISTVAGTTVGFSGDGGPATAAQLAYPEAVAVDAAGNLYIADAGNDRVRRVGTSGTITTVAGNGSDGSSGDGGPATSAQLAYPSGVATDAAGNLFIADSRNDRVRKVAPAGTMTTVAGDGTDGSSGDGGQAAAAQLTQPSGVAVDATGALYIADTGNSRARRVAPSGIIATVAGNGTDGSSGDGGPAVAARLSAPTGVAVDAGGSLHIADRSNGRVRVVRAASPPAFTAAAPPTTAAANVSYGPYTFAATGTPAPAFSVASGALPAGLSLSPTTGVLAGVPTAGGVFTFSVRAANGIDPDAVSPALTLTVAPALDGSSFTPVSPARVWDSRVGPGPTGAVGAGQTRDITVTGVGGVPLTGATAVVLNVTAVSPSAATYVTAWPSGETKPLASNLNIPPGDVRPNLVIVKVGANGKVSFSNDAGTLDLIADIAGYYGATGSRFTSLSPARVWDSRVGPGPTGAVGAGQTRDITVTGVGGVPLTGATAVVLNVTAVSPSAATYVTAWPSGETKPLASNLNIPPGDVRPNLVIVKVGANGKVSFSNDAGTLDLIADIAGYYGAQG